MNPDTEPIRNTQERPPKIFLEVGTRYSPVLLVGNRRLSADERYVGIDMNLEDLTTGASAAQSIQPEASERMLFINADGKRLPLADASVHEALLNNVLGDPKSVNHALLVKELHRVLAADGTLTISEMYSPQFAPKADIISMCEDVGFELKRIVVPADEDWKEIAGLYGIVGATSPDSDAYIAEFMNNAA